MSPLSNALTRHAFIARQFGGLRMASDAHLARKRLEYAIEAATSLRFGNRDRAALRYFLRNLIARLRSGDIDERTAHGAVDKLAMAAAANSPDVLHLIHAGA